MNSIAIVDKRLSRCLFFSTKNIFQMLVEMKQGRRFRTAPAFVACCRLEGDSSVELDLSAAYCGARNISSLTWSDSVVSRLAEAGMV